MVVPLCASTRTSTIPDLLIVPKNTLSPADFLMSFDSPVKELSSKAQPCPDMIVPSAGGVDPLAILTISPTSSKLESTFFVMNPALV